MSAGPPAWRVAVASRRGSSHVDSGLPNQDAVACQGGYHPVVALADGHGDAACFRSDVGAALAVAAACAEVRRLLARPDPDPDWLARQAETVLPRALVTAWRKEVDAHRVRQPFTPRDQGAVLRAKGPRGWQKVAVNPYVAYGATLLAAAELGGYLLLSQLGDGDLLCVYADGRVERPLPPDERNTGGATTSLCLRDPWQDWRVAMLSPEEAPALVLLASDGLAGALGSDAALAEAAVGLLNALGDVEEAGAAARLDAWLAGLHGAGTGDDTSVGLFWHHAPVSLADPAAHL